VDQLVVDALNVIGSRPTGWWRDRPGAVRRLHARLVQLRAADGTPVLLVVDGRPLADLPEGTDGGVEVRYARRAGPDAADDRIVELLAARPAPRGAVVVTADRALRERLAALGVAVTGPRTLLDRLDAVAPDVQDAAHG